MLIVFCFSLVLLASCLLVAYFGRNWNLKPWVALSSGALLSLSFLDFLPTSFDGENSSEMISLFILSGILIQSLAEIYLIPRLTFLDRLLKLEHSHSSQPHSHVLSPAVACSVVGCLFICSFFDGVRLLAAMELGDIVALETAFALFFHLLSEGMLVAVLAWSSGIKREALMVLVLCMAGALFLGAMLAQLFLFSLSSQLLIAFASGILIYVCFVHLLPFCLRQKYILWFWMGLLTAVALHFVI